MEDSLPLHSLILNPSEIAYSFPPHRRRPLPSRTYDALIQILSLHRPHLQMQEPACGEDGFITHSQVISTDILVPHPNSKGSEDQVVQETPDGEGKENNVFQDCDSKHATTPKLHQPDLAGDSEKQLTPPNEIGIEDYMVVEEKADDCAAQNTKELENVNRVLDIEMDDFGTLKDVELENDSCFYQFSEVLDSCFGSDVAVESSESRQLSQEKGTVSKENLVKNMDYELQMKEMELEKLIYSSGNTEAPLCQNAGEIEEGEISGDAGISGEEALENLHVSEGHFDRDKLLREDTDRGRQQHKISDPSLVNIANIESNPKNVKNRIPARQLQDYHDLDVLRSSHMKIPKRSDTPRCLDAENQINITTEMDENAGKNKRKRTLTKERRAKKKKKERIKRAEKNRELGVKRLKLPTVLKPKQIVYCRHYLQGRCHEGEKCNFSHDTVPLTKSKPCGHFARHSCMKGDDCPFDHQLSKYPCNNYTSNGFCSRGSECMFSHEMPAKSPSVAPSASKHDLISQLQTVPGKEGSHPMPKVNKSELKSPSQQNNQNSSRPMDSFGTSHQKVNSRLCSAANSAQREQLSSKPVPRTGVLAPRGVSFLSNGTVPLGDTDKDKQDGSSAKTIDGVGAGCKGALKMPGATNELNEMSEGVAPRKPRGINFLSFGQPPSDEPTSKILSNLLSTCNDGTHKSAIDDMGKGKQGTGTFNANRQMNQSAVNLVSEMKANETPPTAAQNVNLLSFNRSRLDASEKSNLDSSKGETASPSSRGQTWPLLNTPSSVQKAVRSTLAFAAQLEADVTVGLPHHQRIS
ncbi:zinc finger CCCH domain-containing protein 65-like isoform X2 [Salvia miltiorrhiza]|uniref:zinc finger CCCH domain-containing protein 65-like isoform X2 n=1 Tax=Salvia miltiorrhiza TaxID=226208 RepID=UPI0025ACBD2D|nr:zinc finger CCCH domain-containing protein 65-like isoform X2 [Salvia miltiorrhiza]